MNKKIRLFVVAGLAFFPLLVSSGHASGAVKQTVTWTVIGDCVDLYDEYQTEYVVYEGDDCYFKATVKPAKPFRTIALQWYSDDDGKWYKDSEIKTNRNGIAYLEIDMYDSDGYFYDGSYTYRLGMARLGGSAAKLSKNFTITFIPS